MPGGPIVDADAFGRTGELAFVSRGTLWVLDGPTEQVRPIKLPAGILPESPSFSKDGKWLAFETGSLSFQHAAIWMARGTGKGAHRVTGLVVGDAFGWSPQGDLFAVSAGPSSKHAPFGAPTTVRLVSPDGSNRTLMEALAIVGAAWSPTGASLAVATVRGSSTPTLTSYSLATGKATTWSGIPAGPEEFVIPEGWWNGQGIAYMLIGNGMVPSGEGSFNAAPLYVIAQPDATPRLLGQALPNDSNGAPTAATDGDLAFVANSGEPRVVWDGKQVEICPPGPSTCVSAPAPTGDVTEDPVWSASGTLAYVAAPASPSESASPHAVSAWYGAHSLILYDPSTGTETDVSGAQGATVPEWSSNGKDVLYTAEDGLWLLRNGATAAVEIASPLFSPGRLPNYYGEVDWAQQFSWSNSTPVTPCYVECDPGA